jgi:hypothetical protein
LCPSASNKLNRHDFAPKYDTENEQKIEQKTTVKACVAKYLYSTCTKMFLKKLSVAKLSQANAVHNHILTPFYQTNMNAQKQ